jgi:hypothetical protein
MMITAQQARMEASHNYLSREEKIRADETFAKIRECISEGRLQTSDYFEVGTGSFSNIMNFFQDAGYEVDWTNDGGFAYVAISW